jgi:ATP-binding cassette subfamily F protein 3
VRANCRRWSDGCGNWKRRGGGRRPEYLEAHAKHDALNDPQTEAKARKHLAGLGFQGTRLRPAGTEMSGGWVMRAHMTRLLVMEPDLLLLDEPTNHLDLLSLMWFRNYLKNYPARC